MDLDKKKFDEFSRGKYYSSKRAHPRRRQSKLKHVNGVSDFGSGFALVQNKAKASKSKSNANFDKAHHIPPGPISFTPRDLTKFGLKWKGLIQESEEGANGADRLDQQLEFWEHVKENGGVEKTTVINSLKTVVLLEEPPYEYFDWQAEGPIIGIFKRSGKSIGQAVWINLHEAQILVKLFLYLLKQKMEDLKSGHKRNTFDARFDMEPCLYTPINFLELGVLRDYVMPEQDNTADISSDEVHNKIAHQILMGEPILNASYPVGSVQVLMSTIDKRELFAIRKNVGVEAGQIIWFSVHELQHLVKELVEYINFAVTYLGTLH